MEFQKKETFPSIQKLVEPKKIVGEAPERRSYRMKKKKGELENQELNYDKFSMTEKKLKKLTANQSTNNLPKKQSHKFLTEIFVSDLPEENEIRSKIINIIQDNPQILAIIKTYQTNEIFLKQKLQDTIFILNCRKIVGQNSSLHKSQIKEILQRKVIQRATNVSKMNFLMKACQNKENKIEKMISERLKTLQITEKKLRA